MKLLILFVIVGAQACPQGLTPCEEKSLSKRTSVKYVQTGPVYSRPAHLRTRPVVVQSGSSGYYPVKRRQGSGGTCARNEDCPPSRSCQQERCVDPCAGTCGTNARCKVIRHIAVCSCPPGAKGDPFVNCREEPRTCPDGHTGHPDTGCFRLECTSNSGCRGDQICQNYNCESPCVGLCGDGAECDVRNHRASCKCPNDYLGDPFTRCYPECTSHSECPAYQACFGIKCVDPCEGVCGIGANCEVKNHKAICSCPKDYTGHPYEKCVPFTPEDLCRPNPCGTHAECHPGKDREGNDRPVCVCPRGYTGDPLTYCKLGDCVNHGDCPNNRACYNAICEDPCHSAPCGYSAECISKNHGAVCRCPKGYEGDPMKQCILVRRRNSGGVRTRSGSGCPSGAC